MAVANGRLTMSVGDAALLACVAAFATGVAAGNKPAEAAPPAYVGAGSFLLPSAASVFDDAADGTLVCVDGQGNVLRQIGVGLSAYVSMGVLPGGSVPAFGAGFVRISPDGTRLAIGDNGTAGRVLIAPIASVFSPTTIVVPNFDGAWADNTTLYINGSPSFGTPPSLYRVNITTSAVAAVVSNIGDGSGGVATRSGRVFTAIGFDAGGMLDGQVRSFDIATLNVAGSAVAFSTGTLVTQAGTGNSLDFDAAGNIIEAGFGGVTLVDLATGQRYDLPGLSPTGFYSAIYNDFTHEILVRDFGSQTVQRYAIPAPASAAMLGLTGILATRRKRHA